MHFALEPGPKKSRSGLLRAAIENDYAAPTTSKTSQPRPRQRRLNSTEQAQPRRREDHEERFWPRYLVYLRAEEERIQKEAPAAYAGFQNQRSSKQAQAVASNKPWIDAQYLARLDSESARLGELQKEFSLPSFWQWDESSNETPFGSIGAQLPKVSDLSL